MGLSETLALLDKAVDANFVATLAGLSLAAIAFFVPSSDTILAKAKKEKDDLENKVSKWEELAYPGETANTKRIEELNSIIKSVSDATAGLLKSFVIFSWFLVYTITIDQVIDEKTVIEIFSSQAKLFVQTGETLVSYFFLSLAGYNLWKGVSGIKTYFNVSFDDERRKAIDFLKRLKK